MNDDLIQRWEKAVAAQPGNDLARFSLGKALFDAERPADALVHFESALARKPDWMVVQILVGRCHQARGDRSAAREAFRKGLALAIAQHHEGPQAEMEQLLADLGED
jgi:predicted Zn-dependent protease